MSTRTSIVHTPSSETASKGDNRSIKKEVGVLVKEEAIVENEFVEIAEDVAKRVVVKSEEEPSGDDNSSADEDGEYETVAPDAVLWMVIMDTLLDAYHEFAARNRHIALPLPPCFSLIYRIADIIYHFGEPRRKFIDGFETLELWDVLRELDQISLTLLSVATAMAHGETEIENLRFPINPLVTYQRKQLRTSMLELWSMVVDSDAECLRDAVRDAFFALRRSEKDKDRQPTRVVIKSTKHARLWHTRKSITRFDPEHSALFGVFGRMRKNPNFTQIRRHITFGSDFDWEDEVGGRIQWTLAKADVYAGIPKKSSKAEPYERIILGDKKKPAAKPRGKAGQKLREMELAPIIKSQAYYVMNERHGLVTDIHVPGSGLGLPGESDRSDDYPSDPNSTRSYPKDITDGEFDSSEDETVKHVVKTKSKFSIPKAAKTPRTTITDFFKSNDDNKATAAKRKRD